MKHVVLAVIVLLSINMQAQTPAGNEKFKISGRVIDSTNQQPVYYATIALFPNDSNKPINGTTADEKGNFSLTVNAAGIYRIEVDFMGYKPYNAKGIILNSQTPNAKLPIINLAPASHQLKDVEVVAKKAAVEYKNDKTVYNVENDITSQNGSASDALKKLPEVSVDIDGNVELQGNANIKFLINGKPSSMFGNNLAEALKAIPASMIKSIEVITSPGAKYDGEGTGGIINIILKSSRLEGINGSAYLSGGTRNQNGSFNLTVKKGKWSFNTWEGANGQINTVTGIVSDQISARDSLGSSTRVLQRSTNDYKRYGAYAGFGIDYELSPKDNIHVGGGGNFGRNFNQGPTYVLTNVKDSMGTDLSNVYSKRDAHSKWGNQSFDWNVLYTKTFKEEDRLLTVLYSSSYGMNHNYYSRLLTDSAGNNIFGGTTSDNPGTDWTSNLQIDYTHPFGKKVILETGAKTVFQRITANADARALNIANGEYNSDYFQSYALKFNRNIYAAYLASSFNLIERFQFKVGFRFERTDNSGQFSNVPNVSIPAYNTALPSASLMYEFKHEQTLRLGYSHRLERPDYRALNPFLNAADPHNISTGNPSLQPELSDKVELTYRKSFGQIFSFNLNSFYQRNTQDIKQITTYYNSYVVGDSAYPNVSLTAPANVASEQKVGLSGYFQLQTDFKLNVNTNISGFERYVSSYLGNVNGLEYRINGNINYQLPKQISMEFFASYNSSRIGLQGTYPAYTSYSFAIRKLFLNDKLSVGLNCSNPFSKTVTQKTVINDPHFNLVTVRDNPYQSFALSISYKFGKLELKKDDEQSGTTD